MPSLVEDQKFERYRINRWVGSGISGETYEAEDTTMLRKVALKLIHPWAALPDAARRQFFREMQGLSQLHHPALASILDYGEFAGKLYVARRYATIGSLLSNEGRTWFKPPLPIRDAFRYAHQLAQVLHAIHTQGYLHGSLTLSNILILRGYNYEQEPDFAPFLISDAGLASFVRRFGQPSIALLPVASAPEQLNRRITPASDQFALAVLVYFWLAGRMPFLGSSEEIEHQKLTGCIIPLTSLNHTVTQEQEEIVRRALAASPHERYPSMLSFAGALLATLETPATTPEPQETIAAAVEAPPVFEPVPQTEPELVKELTPAYETVSETGAEFSSTGHDNMAAPAATVTTPDTEPLAPAEPTLEPENIASIDESSTPVTSTHPRLIITCEGDEDQQELLLEPVDYTLGRAGSDNIFLNDSSVSRHHALLHYQDGRYMLSDQRSAGGVFVNGEKLADQEIHALAEGDHIRIGLYDISFHQG